MTQTEHRLRRGLPRTPGGQPWPVVLGEAPAAHAETVLPAEISESKHAVAVSPETSEKSAPSAAAHGAVEPAVIPAETVAAVPGGDGIRRGLPRIAGGAPWPAGEATASVAATPAAEPRHAREAEPEVSSPAASATAHIETSPAPSAERAALGVAPATPVVPTQAAATSVAPAPAPTPPQAAAPVRPAAQAAAPAAAPAAGPPAKLSTRQRVGVGVVGAFAIFGFVAAVVLLARWVAGFESVSGFMNTYPGEYALPVSAPEGLPVWLGWQHFFNLFFLVLIVRSGLQVRHQQRPPAYWASKRNPQQKISIMLWFHQTLDVLWMTNGVLFVILLFATGQWMRVVPTSWEVFPNALSAGLQYLTLNWPVENGWINYNSLQQLAYFATIFIAAPLAIASGVRLSGFWPKDKAKLSAAYPIEVARAVHFPVMLYFVGFTVIHVTLVLTTGALRNLNHMYGARDEVSWFGAIVLLISLAVIAGAYVAARPMVLAPIARLMGNVSAR